MARQGINKVLPYLEILTPDQENALHQATMTIMHKTGIRFDHDKALEILGDAGCSVDSSNNRVRIPENLVMDALEKCPSVMHVKSKNPDNDLEMIPGKTTYFSPSIGLSLHDIDKKENRAPTRKEFYDHVRIIDALPHADLQVCFPLWGFDKVPQCMSLLETNAAKLRLSSKAMMEGSTLDNYKFIIAMAKATDQDILQLINPTAPLTYPQEIVDQMLYIADEGMPYHICPGLSAGSSGPATLSGLVASNNAITLAGVVLAQLYKPGTRMWIGSMMMNTNMKTGSPAFGDIGNSLAETVFCQMARRYQIPCWTSAGAWTSSNTIDYQAGYELTTGMIMNSLAGSNLVLFQGGLTAELAANTEKLIIDDDVVGMIKRFSMGVQIDDETLALDEIDRVGPVPGNFLTGPHTLNWWRKEGYLPQVADREPYDNWLKNGKLTTIEYAKARKEEILASHEDTRLTPEEDQAIEDILNEAREHYRSNGSMTDTEWKLYQEDLNSKEYPFE